MIANTSSSLFSSNQPATMDTKQEEQNKINKGIKAK